MSRAYAQSLLLNTLYTCSLDVDKKLGSNTGQGESQRRRDTSETAGGGYSYKHRNQVAKPVKGGGLYLQTVKVSNCQNSKLSTFL